MGGKLLVIFTIYIMYEVFITLRAYHPYHHNMYRGVNLFDGMSTGIFKKPSVRLQNLKIENIYQVYIKK